MENPSQTYGASPTIWDHTGHLTQANEPYLNSSQTVRYQLIFPGGTES